MEKLPRQQQSDTLQHPCIGGFKALRITFVGCSTTPRGINLIFSSMLCLLDQEKNANEQSFKRRKIAKKQRWKYIKFQ